MTEPFILRHLVTSVLNDSAEADPGVIAEIVMQRIAAGDSREALFQTMRLFVRQIISETRCSNRPSNVTPIHNSGRSVRVAAIRDAWQRRLLDRVHTGEGGWKQLGQCSYDDLMRVADQRQEQARRNVEWAREYRTMAEAVLAAGVERFADLPVETQASLLGGAA